MASAQDDDVEIPDELADILFDGTNVGRVDYLYPLLLELLGIGLHRHWVIADEGELMPECREYPEHVEPTQGTRILTVCGDIAVDDKDALPRPPVSRPQDIFQAWPIVICLQDAMPLLHELWLVYLLISLDARRHIHAAGHPLKVNHH